jgi:hypothetical protein
LVIGEAINGIHPFTPGIQVFGFDEENRRLSFLSIFLSGWSSFPTILKGGSLPQVSGEEAF